MTGVDNSKLKAMMVIDPEQESDEEQEIFFEEFKNSTFLILLKEDGMPARFKSEVGSCIVPLFTDEEELNKLPIPDDLRIGWIRARIICELTSELDKVDEIAINPASENAIGMSYETFLAIFKDDKLAEIDEIIRDHGITVTQETRFYLREEAPFMKEEVVDGIFTSEVPFLANFEDNFDKEKMYTNILIIPKGVRFLPVGENEIGYDTIFAPTIKFKLIEENGQILTWKCISQELNNPKKSNKIIYLIIAIIIIVLIITIIKVIL